VKTPTHGGNDTNNGAIRVAQRFRNFQSFGNVFQALDKPPDPQMGEYIPSSLRINLSIYLEFIDKTEVFYPSYLECTPPLGGRGAFKKEKRLISKPKKSVKISPINPISVLSIFLNMKKFNIKAITLSATFFLFGKILLGQAITGTIFLDVNANGQKDATEVGVSGATVTAFNAAGASFGPFTSAASTGAYTTTALSAGTYRLEITPPTGYFATPKGATSNTTVQFVAAGTTTANLGILYPSDYCQTPVNLELPCYESGGAVIAWNTASTHPAIVAVPSTAAPTSVPAKTMNVGYGNVGSTWGAAYKRDAGRMFFSNVFKRHSDLGEFARPDATGTQTADGIYMVDHVNDGLAGIYKGGFRLQGVNGIDLGSVARSYKSTAITATSAADDNKLSTVNRQNRDLAAFAKVGKIGLGDIHISEDFKTLWAVNLSQRNLIKIDVSDLSLLPTTGGTIGATLVSTLEINYALCGAVTGTLRPWAITIWHGRGYVGVVNDALGGTAANMKAFVLSFDAATGGGWVKEFEMSLDFNRETSAWPTSQNTTLRQGKWRPWIDTWAFPTLSEEFSYPQPLLANIEFTPNGSMVLGFLDRAGLQFDYNELSPLTGNTKLLSVDAAGDVVFVCKNGGTFVVEGDAGCVIDSDPGTPNLANDGPKNVGEFFYQDYAQTGTTAHYEEAFGALAMLLGPQQVVTTGFDVVTEQFNQGMDFYSTVTGKQTSAYQVTPNNVNKGVGLGEPEPLCSVAPIQIGNFVWKDTDGDGTQDPGETALAGVTVKLYAADGTSVLGTAVTDANGQYFFSNQTGTSTANNIYGLTTIKPNLNYFLRITSLGTSPTVAGLSVNNPTTGGSVGLNGGTSLANNDAALSAGMPSIALKTGTFGENNHTYDFGFIACSLTPTATVNPATPCAGQSVNLAASGGAGGATYAWSGPNGFTSTTQNPMVSAVSAANAGTYTVTITNFPGCTATATVMFTVNTVTAAAMNTSGCQGEPILLTATGASGATYAWSGPNGFTSTAQNPSILLSKSDDVGVYAVIVTLNGCTASANTTVALSTSGPVIACNSPVCVGNALTLSASSGTSYVWSGPGTFSSTTTQNPTVTGLAAGSHTFAVTVTGGACTGNTTKNITINASPVATVTAATICEGESLQLHATGGTSYAWSGPGGWSSTLSDPTINPALSAENTGSYSVTITNPATFCTASVSATVLGGPLMLTNYAEIISADNTVTNATLANNSLLQDDDALVMTELINCTLPTATLTPVNATCGGAIANSDAAINLTGITNGDRVAWSQGAIYTGAKYLAATSFTGSTYTIAGLPNPSVPTIYTIRVFNVSQCCARDYQVTILPTPCASAASNSPICSNGTLELSASGGDSYSWTGPGGFTSTLQNPTRNPAVAGSYSVTATIGAATSVATTTVIVNAPTVTATANTPVPVGQKISLIASGGATYNWSGPNSFTSTESTPSITSAVLANGGTYSVTATDATGCTAVATVAVSVVTPPSNCTMTVIAASNAPICAESTLNLTATPSSAAVNYAWSGPASYSANVQNPTIEGTSTNHNQGTYTVTATAADGCTAIATVNVIIDTMPNLPVISGTICTAIGDTISLVAEGSATGNYLWTLPNTTTLTGKTVLIPAATLAAHNGLWTVALTSGTCVVTQEITVTVKPQTHLVLEKIADKTQITAGSNETVVFTIKLTNQGSSPATDVLVKDKLPSGLSYVSYTSSVAGTYDPISGIWTIPSAPSGDSTLTITATVQ
jgi:uncharacterized repeat protein (TIGR01451 family)